MQDYKRDYCPIQNKELLILYIIFLFLSLFWPPPTSLFNLISKCKNYFICYRITNISSVNGRIRGIIDQAGPVQILQLIIALMRWSHILWLSGKPSVGLNRHHWLMRMVGLNTRTFELFGIIIKNILFSEYSQVEKIYNSYS